MCHYNATSSFGYANDDHNLLPSITGADVQRRPLSPAKNHHCPPIEQKPSTTDRSDCFSCSDWFSYSSPRPQNRPDRAQHRPTARSPLLPPLPPMSSSSQTNAAASHATAAIAHELLRPATRKRRAQAYPQASCAVSRLRSSRPPPAAGQSVNTRKKKKKRSKSNPNMLIRSSPLIRS